MPWFENRRGEQLWYEDNGSGIPLVLLHGWCMSSAIWKYQFDALASSFRLIAPDLSGHGCSRGMHAKMDFDGFSEDLIDLFDTMEIKKAILVGWSMGGQIAIKTSLRLSDRLAGLVLVSSTPCFTASADFLFGLASNEATGMRLKLQRNQQRARDGFYTRLFADGELEENLLAADIRELLATIVLPDSKAALDALDSLASTDMRHLLAGVDVPTIVINGSEDRICLPDASRYLKEHIAGATQRVFDSCGHAPFLTQHTKFNNEIIEFAGRVCEQNACNQ